MYYFFHSVSIWLSMAYILINQDFSCLSNPVIDSHKGYQINVGKSSVRFAQEMLNVMFSPCLSAFVHRYDWCDVTQIRAQCILFEFFIFKMTSLIDERWWWQTTANHKHHSKTVLFVIIFVIVQILTTKTPICHLSIPTYQLYHAIRSRPLNRNIILVGDLPWTIVLKGAEFH